MYTRMEKLSNTRCKQLTCATTLVPPYKIHVVLEPNHVQAWGGLFKRRLELILD